VADDDRPAGEGAQEVAQPDHRVGVEVVGRLVEQQRVGLGEQDAGQLHPAALAARQGAQGLVEHPAGQPQRGRDRGGLALGRVAAQGQELRLHLRVATHRLVPGARVTAGQHLLLLAHLADHSVQATGTEDAVPGQLARVPRSRVLRQVAHGPGAGDGASRRLALPGEDAGEGRLAGPVASHQPDGLAGPHPERRAGEQQLAAGAHLDVGGDDHASTSDGRTAGRQDGGTAGPPLPPGCLVGVGDYPSTPCPRPSPSPIRTPHLRRPQPGGGWPPATWPRSRWAPA